MEATAGMLAMVFLFCCGCGLTWLIGFIMGMENGVRRFRK